MAKPPDQPSLTDLAARVDKLLEFINAAVRLSRKDVLRRFGWSDSTLRRRLKERRFPLPQRDEGGHPYWRPADLAL